MINSIFYSPSWAYVDRFLKDPYLVDLEEFVAGGQGHDWLSKAGQAEQHKYMAPYYQLQKRFQDSPKALDVVHDNIYRLTLLSGVERLLTLRQAYGALKQRFTFADTNTACLQQIFNQGTFTGYFRGSLLNALQFVTNWAHPLFYSQGKGYAAHVLYSSAFETLTYPIDTVKTILYADIRGQYKGAFDVIEHVYQRNGISHFYQGLLFKLAFNASLIFHLRNIYEDSLYGQILSLPLLALGYGLLTAKTRLQLTGTELSFLEPHQTQRIQINLSLQKSSFSIFRGLIPFMLLTDLFHYNLYALYSETAQKKTLEEILALAREKIRSPKAETLWI